MKHTLWTFPYIPSRKAYVLGFFFLLLVTQPVAAQTLAPAACQPLLPANSRFGINVARDGGKQITDYAVEQLQAGWYLDYHWQPAPPRPNGMTYVQMIRRWQTDAAWQTKLAAAIAANPGALWILGNEPDHRGQDNRTADDYAVFYDTAATFLKTHDPTSRIAIAAVTQPTPLRLRYLDMVLSAYHERYGKPMPIDVWTVHAYILPEDYVWGVGIPPGMDDFADEGMAYSLTDHGNLDLFAAQIRAFRRWMAARGYGDKPLILSEFGILLPPTYGYTADKVSAFMRQSFAWLQTASDPQLGYAADEDRLVQAWAWFSLNYYAYDPVTGIGHNGNLFDHGNSMITPVGRTFAAYMAQLRAPKPTPIIVAATVTPATRQAGATNPLTLHLSVANAGDTPLTELTLTLSWGERAPATTVQMRQTIAPQCTETVPITLTWTPPPLAPGRHALTLAVSTDPQKPIQEMVLIVQAQ